MSTDVPLLALYGYEKMMYILQVKKNIIHKIIILTVFDHLLIFKEWFLI